MYECHDCGRRYEERATAPFRCACGGPLDFADLSLSDDAPDTLDRDRGLWAFDSALPVDRLVTLGEGWTPLVDAPDWDATVKLEYVFPTGSFKDRGAAVTLSHAADLGVERVLEDSSGNAGAAIATYAARAGIGAEIYVPADAKRAKRRAIERTGADLVAVEGDRAAVTAACQDAVGAGGWYASHAWQPAFLAGTATFAFETAAQNGWTAPDAIVTPLGHGTLFLGAYRGFQMLAEAGWTERVPRLYGAQAAGTAPIVADRHGDAAASGANDVSDGIQIETPARRAQTHEAIEATDGDAIAVTASETRAQLDRLDRAGLSTEPTCAVAPAALDRLREDGTIDADEDVVVPLTGSGLKR
ncbi:pyridoxal-phosphate dependent enzyme [Halovenus marina]|uniref:pyridoxal-phosphate dependent enzyme n=1 Tax=Halovenus marina TaxID=3396621 RepID=UPI003F57070F